MNQPDIEEGATARLCAAMHKALRSAPAVSRGDPFPRAWWQHLAAQDMLGVGFDPDGGEPCADWPAVAALADIIACETAHLGLALGWLMNEMLGRFVIGPHVGHDGHRALLRMMAAGRKIVALAISEPRPGPTPSCCGVRRASTTASGCSRERSPSSATARRPMSSSCWRSRARTRGASASTPSSSTPTLRASSGDRPGVTRCCCRWATAAWCWTAALSPMRAVWAPTARPST
jgi:hypothetical protein